MNNNTHNYVYMKFLIIIIIIKSEHHPGSNHNEYTPKQHRREHPCHLCLFVRDVQTTSIDRISQYLPPPPKHAKPIHVLDIET